MDKVVERLKTANGVLAATAVAVGLGIWVFFGKNLPNSVPIFYSRPWGEEQLGKPIELAWPLGLTTIICLGVILGTKFLKSDSVLATITLACGMVIGLILILATLRSVVLIV